KILTGHEPFPAVIVDRRWDLVSANRPALAVMGEAASPELLTPPVNALRISLHPDGLAPHIVNLAEYSAHLLTRLHRQMILSGDDELAGLYDELCQYPGVVPSSTAVDTASLLFVPFVLRAGDGVELSFFSTLAT